jgi:hypothetical protein
MGRLKYDVVVRLAHIKLTPDFPLQIVSDILCFPIAMCQPEVIDQSTIHTEGELVRTPDFPFRHQRPIMLPGAVSEKILERGSNCRFMPDAQLLKLA